MKKDLPKLRQAIDGEWFSVKNKGYILACCDCGLTHVVDFHLNPVKTPKGKDYGLWQIEMRVKRLPALTKKIRLQKKFRHPK